MLWQQVQGQNNIKGEKQHGKREAGLCGEEGAFCHTKPLQMKLPEEFFLVRRIKSGPL